ncbi:hypothetical protein EU510_00960 [Pseudoalteromonas sp. FUC4]|uniref:Imm44 family immunity protein n=1 Tax=Pseudoalteromonas sp. FUC4 TaxID=2511201 RepID=UPI0011F2F1F1|nr:Imm44 family immunity protein [Pseudoalteromonas sp. FUC4]KAA1154714.1 hypothetical protein EU510_00960 [Pseudoalteromonas sp. FUC4]
MRIWIGGEIESSIEDDFRKARSKVEKSINENIEQNTYNIPVESWDCIAIVRDDEQLEELFAYDSRNNDMDFRLRVDYQRFLVGNSNEQEQQVFEICLRSLRKLQEFIGSSTDLSNLIKDVSKIGKLHGWLS